MQTNIEAQSLGTIEQTQKPQTSNKLTRYDIINKNFILPQQNYPKESTYHGAYKNSSSSRVQTERVNYPQNQVIPKGKFQGGSSYLVDYTNGQGIRGELMKREGELKIGGSKFQGYSSYANDYMGKGGSKQQRVRFPQNKFMPEGKFQEGSTYARNYLNNPVQHVEKIKPEGELKMSDARFQGQSSYVANYDGRQNPSKSQKVKYPENDVLPKGMFQGSSTYGGAYQGAAQSSKNVAIRPEGELKVGGQFYGQSNYSNNYYDKGVMSKPEKYQQPRNQILPKGQFQHETTYGGNYVQNPIQINQKFKPEGELKVGGNVFEGYSNYTSEFMKKEGIRAEKVPPPHNDVIPKGNFTGNSTYGQSYIENAIEKNKQFRPEGELKVGGKFEGNSSYANDYESKMSPGKREKVTYKDNEVIPKGNFSGDSTYQHNYIEMERLPNKQFRPEQQLKVGGKFQGHSSYEDQYYNKGFSGKQEKYSFPPNQILPQGRFEDGTTYAGNYIESKVERNPQFKPQGELSVGVGRFQGTSSYGAEYTKKEGAQKLPKAVLPQNEVIPKGNFAGNSTYQAAYLGETAARNPQFRPENNLISGGNRFEGSSSYAVEYDPRAQGRRYLNKQGQLLRRD